MTALHPAQPRRERERWITTAELRNAIADPENAVIVDAKVADLHQLAHPGLLRVRAGERLKSFAGLRRLSGFIVERVLAGAARVLAIGGGTVGDAAALAAHLVRRGTPLVHVPSTLLAAVDSSIGGKAGINGDGGAKNILGAYHFADETLLAPELWTTLAMNRRREGAAEAMKMALCLDAKSCAAWCKNQPDEREMVIAGRALKHAVVDADPFEMAGKRQVLNFGHTVGHALEMLTRHRLPHGAAVALGIRAELDIAVRAGLTAGAVAGEAESLLDQFHLPKRERLNAIARNTDWESFRAALRHDKKGFLRFIILDRIGSARMEALDEKTVRAAFTAWRQS